MPDGFGVVPSELSGIVEGVKHVVSELSMDTSTVSGDVVGHGGLASALAGFGSRWVQGVKCLTDDSQRFAGGLSRCAASYEGVEQKIAKVLSESGS